MLAADDERRAAELVESNLYPLLNQQVPAPVLDRWLALFSESAIQAHPGLLIAQIFLFVFRWDMAAMATAVSQTRLLIPEAAGADKTQQRRQATLDTQQGYLLYWHGDFPRAMTLLQKALDTWQDPVADLFMQSQAILFLAFATANCGQREAALARLRTALAEARSHDRPTVLIYLIGCTVVHLYAAEFATLSRTATEVVTLANAWQARPGWSAASTVQVWRGWAYYFLGLVAYEQNDLETAVQHWQQVERYRVNPGTFHNSLVGLALVAQVRGEGIVALAHAQTAREFAAEQHSPALLRLSDALEARLALQGDGASESLHRLQGTDTAAFHSHAFWLEPPPLTALRLLIDEATSESLAEAVAVAEACLQQAEKAHDTRRVIQVSALQALIWHTLRQPALAFAVLDRALTLGEPGGFTRTFLDLGSPMAELLHQFDNQHEPWPYVKRLLTAFTREVALSDRASQTAAYVQYYGITPLTPRELELLELVGQRLTVKEMAERLVISTNTVKRHVSSIYSKLGVKNRRQAIARAREAGLLPAG
jgi:LuxR family maltose regulon positive regulatory protein